MLDFHSHILPEIDDGAKDVDESIAMLSMLKEQGVDTVALTPHYIAMDESPSEFLSRREESFNALNEEIAKRGIETPKLMLGAEVYYYPGICKMDELSTLTLKGTNLLLLEMPVAPWGEYALKEIDELMSTSDVQVVLAHIERYIKYQKRGTLERLLNMGVIFQVNASFFISRKTRRKAIKMLKDGYITFIGSDCHSTKHRPPKIDEAIAVIKEKLSDDFINNFIENQYKHLNQ